MTSARERLSKLDRSWLRNARRLLPSVRIDSFPTTNGEIANPVYLDCKSIAKLEYT